MPDWLQVLADAKVRFPSPEDGVELSMAPSTLYLFQVL